MAVNKNEKETETKAPKYSSNYTSAIKDNLTKVMSNGRFSYNADSDKLFGQYKDSYEKAGQKAMEDTVGNASLLTGGYANSYAVTAGQQAYNEYMSKLSDKIPELEQRAYERYRDDEDSAYRRLGTLMELENTDYGRYRDEVGDYNANRQFEYNKSKDDREQKNRDEEFERSKFESDRQYARDVYESDRDYAKSVSDSDRSYELKKNASGDKEDESNKFSPSDAYEFISKYNDKIYSDEEFCEALFQLYGDKDGFYEWMSRMKIPGDTGERTYLELLYQIHPELSPSIASKSGLPKNSGAYASATNGGATPPHSLSLR
ncbi:MAG: hypothetical protein ACI4JI_03240 [Ruminiclostridium sp.]